MAKKDTPGEVEAVVLRDCVFGAVGEVVFVHAANAAVGKELGMLDLHQSAIDYAKSIDKK